MPLVKLALKWLIINYEQNKSKQSNDQHRQTWTRPLFLSSQLCKSSRAWLFGPSSYLARLWSPVIGPCVPSDQRPWWEGFWCSRPLSCQPEQKQTRRLQFLLLLWLGKKINKQTMENQSSETARSAPSLWNEHFLIPLPGMAPGPQDNVDGWCFNAAECYFYWTGKTINFYFIGNDCALCNGCALPMNNRLSQQMLLRRNQFLG